MNRKDKGRRADHCGALTIGSLFSGIGGFDLGFEQAGWKVAWQVEMEPFCRRILEKRFPQARRFKDVQDIYRFASEYAECDDCGEPWCERHGKHFADCGCIGCSEWDDELPAVDLICAGVPCQDVSVAGKRAGLAGERTGLFYEFARILRGLRPTWFVFENVPGLFSSNNGRDFAEILRVLMVECGYGVCWRVLDSQFFGVAQRRRRVFIVGHLGKPCPAAVLFEQPCGSGDIAAGQKAWPGIAGEAGGGADIVGQAISSKWSKGSSGPAGDEAHTRLWCSSPAADGYSSVRTAQTGANGIGVLDDDTTHTLDGTGGDAVAFDAPVEPSGPGRVADGIRDIAASDGQHAGTGTGSDDAMCFESRFARNGRGAPDSIVPPLKAESGQTGKGDGAPLVYGPWQQDLARSISNVGDGNDYGANKGTLIAGTVTASCGEGIGLADEKNLITGTLGGGRRGTDVDAAAGNQYVRQATDANGVRDFTGLPEGLDSARYRALGNAVTVQVARWIAERIMKLTTKDTKEREG